MADVETFGLELHRGDGASPEVYTKIAGVTELPTVFSYTRSQIETSEIGDTTKTFLGGQLDPGEVQFGVKFDHEETTHGDNSGLVASMTNRGRENWYIKIPESTADGAAPTYATFAAVMTSLQVSGAQDDVLRGTATLKISGAITFSASAP